MRHLAVYGSTRVLAGDNSAQPIHVLEDTGRGRIRVREHPLYDALRFEPNADMSAADLRKTWIIGLCLRGNAYSFIDRAKNGRVKRLLYINPDEIVPRFTDDDTLVYDYRPNQLNKPADTFAAEEILHFRGMSYDGIVGVSPIKVTCDPIGAALAANQYANRFFSGGGQQRMVFETDAPLSPEARDELSQDYHRKYAGAANAHKVPFLVSGLKAKVLGISPEDAQLLETRKHDGQTIAMSIYGVPAFRIGIATDKAETFASISAHQVAYAIYTMLPINVSIEQELMRKLLTRADRQRFTIEHLMDGLLRADPKTQSEILSTGVMHGRYTLNDVRDIDNRPRYDDLADQPMVPSTMMPLSQMAARPAAKADGGEDNGSS